MYSLLPISCPILKKSIIDGKGHSQVFDKIWIIFWQTEFFHEAWQPFYESWWKFQTVFKRIWMYSLLPISCPILKKSIIDGKCHSQVFNKIWIFFWRTEFCRKHDPLFMSFDENSRLFLNEFECIRYFPSLAQLKKLRNHCW